VRTHQQSRVESTDRVESNQVCAIPNGVLVLFEQCTSKEVYSDGEHACLHAIMWWRCWRPKRRNTCRGLEL